MANVDKSIKNWSVTPGSNQPDGTDPTSLKGDLQALQAGVPQIIQPYAFDQFDNAARIEKLGVGRMISKRSFRSSTLAQYTEDLLASEEVASACQTTQNLFKDTNPLRESCVLIEQIGTRLLGL